MSLVIHVSARLLLNFIADLFRSKIVSIINLTPELHCSDCNVMINVIEGFPIPTSGHDQDDIGVICTEK